MKIRKIKILNFRGINQLEWNLPDKKTFCLIGIGFVLLGLFGSSSKMKDWAEVSSRHEASLIIMVLAYPVYLVLSLFYER